MLCDSGNKDYISIVSGKSSWGGDFRTECSRIAKYEKQSLRIKLFHLEQAVQENL